MSETLPKATFDGCLARARIKRAVELLASTFTNEDELQQAVGAALEKAGIAHEREKHLCGDAGRIDFLTADGVGIECKVKGSFHGILPQLFRYLDAPECHGGVVLVTTKATHRAPVAGLPLTFVVLTGGARG